MHYVVSAEIRTTHGKCANRRMRREGTTPAILYGRNQPTILLTLDHHEFQKKRRLPNFSNSILTLVIGSEKHDVILRDVQMHVYKSIILHIDFEKIHPDRRLTLRVPLSFINAEQCLAKKTGTGLVNHVHTHLEVTCLAKDIPSCIEVDLSNLSAGGALHISDIQLPDRVTSTALARKEDLPLVTIVGAAEEEVEASATATTTPPSHVKDPK